MPEKKGKNLKWEAVEREGHMCVNPNICDICNGIATTEDEEKLTENLLAKVVYAQA